MQHFVSLIIFCGALQCLIIGFVLLLKGIRLRLGIFYLGLVIAGIGLILTRFFVRNVLDEPLGFLVTLNIVLLICPSLFLYAKETAKPTKLAFQSIYWHFLPFCIINIGFVFFDITYSGTAEYNDYMSSLLKVNDIVSILYYYVYLFCTFRMLKLNRLLYDEKQYKFSLQIVFTFLIISINWLILLIAEIRLYAFSPYINAHYVLILPVAIIFYYISQKVVIGGVLLWRPKDVAKRKSFFLSPSEYDKIESELTAFMKEKKPFLNGGLTIAMLSEQLNINAKILSFVINDGMKLNFNDYINSWRIEEVKLRLDDVEYRNHKMLSIAFDCGFNSKSTFNLAFKKATGVSPSEYRNH